MGKNVSIPTLNMVETVFVCKPSEHGRAATMSAAEIISPAQPLPSANVATLRNRWAAWSLLTSRFSGPKLAGDSDLSARLRDLPLKCLVMVSDNLIVNDGVLCLEEETIAGNARLQNDGYDNFLVFSVRCCCHSAVLTTQPIFGALGDITTILVRLGHLMESARVAKAYTNSLRNTVSKWFKFVRVRRLPEGAEDWAQRSRQVLEQTRGAQDLSEEQERVLLAAANGDWSKEEAASVCAGTCGAKLGRMGPSEDKPTHTTSRSKPTGITNTSENQASRRLIWSCVVANNLCGCEAPISDHPPSEVAPPVALGDFLSEVSSRELCIFGPQIPASPAFGKRRCFSVSFWPCRPCLAFTPRCVRVPALSPSGFIKLRAHI